MFVAPFENLLFFACVTISHRLLYLPSNSAYFWEVGLDGNVIPNPQTERERPLQFPGVIEGGTEAQGMMSWAFAQSQDTWQLGWGASPREATSQLCGLAWLSSHRGSWCPGLRKRSHHPPLLALL